MQRVLVNDARVVPDEGEHAGEAAGLEHRSGLASTNKLKNLKHEKQTYVITPEGSVSPNYVTN